VWVRRQIQWLQGWGLLFSLIGLSACNGPKSLLVLPGQGPKPLPQDPLIQVYMNQEVAVTYTEPYRRQTRSGENLEQRIIDVIKTAKTTIEVAVQELRLPGIAQALVEKHQAGVKVRVILENSYSRPWSDFSARELQGLDPRERDRYQEFLQLADLDGNGQVSPQESQQRDALVMLKTAGIPMLDDTADGSEGSSLMHHKFVVVDRRLVITSSANFTTSDTHGDFGHANSRGNPNNLLQIESLELATIFVQEFDLMWGDGPGGQPDSRFGLQKPPRPAKQVAVGSSTVTVKFSPASPSLPWDQSGNGLIGRTLARTTRQVDLALFVFSEQPLADQLAQVQQRGAMVRLLIEPGFAYRYYSELLDVLGVTLPNKCQLEPGNKPWNPPITTAGVPKLPPGDILHHKFAVIDGQVVITGSQNWSAAANHDNDETVLVVENPTVAKHFQREFDRLYDKAILGVPPAITRQVTEQTQACGGQIAAPPASPLAGTQANPAQSGTVNSRVNLNTATQAELESLPGVGPKLAQQIIQVRQQRPFRSLSDLDQVPGVGPALVVKLRDRVTW